MPKKDDAGQANDACEHGSPNSGRADAAAKQKDQGDGCADHLGLTKHEPQDGSASILRAFGLAGRLHLSGHPSESGTANQRRPGYDRVTNWRRGGIASAAQIAKAREYARRWRKTHPDRTAIHSRRYIASHHAALIDKHRNWRRSHPTYGRDYQRLWYYRRLRAKRAQTVLALTTAPPKL